MKQFKWIGVRQDTRWGRTWKLISLQYYIYIIKSVKAQKLLNLKDFKLIIEYLFDILKSIKV